MKRYSCRLGIAVALALAIGCGQAAYGAPQIGYAYPAGGQQGTTFTVEVGGQSLRGADHVRISGDGVRASVLDYAPRLGNREYWPTRRLLQDVVRGRWVKTAIDQAARRPVEIPDHPWLRDLDEMSPLQLDRVWRRFFDPKGQPDAQIAEQVILEVTIDANATPGDRELRIASPSGLSNGICFQVGTLPELLEEQFSPPDSPIAQVVETPVVLNGQILPGEVDRLRLRARRGQQLVIALEGRSLMPYLADAVPGWFQAVIALRDPSGAEVAYCDDYRFDPDPVILYELPADGVYELEIMDAIYRGREDFVYRISIGELPFVTEVFPLGAQEGADSVASLDGWNLPSDSVQLDTSPGGETIRAARIGRGPHATFRYAVDALPEVTEAEPNDTVDQAQSVELPIIVNGRIDRPGDIDIFSFEGRAGEEIVAEVFARRLGSPLDSALRLVGPGGNVLAFNDDHKDPSMGLVTHHADSYIRMQLPADGRYTVHLFDVQTQGGSEFAYRLHLRPAEPDFALRLVPSSINVPPGRSATVTVHAMRRDGFDGEIELSLVDAPDGFTLSAGRIAGEETATLTLSAPRGIPRQVAPVRLEGRAQIGGVTVTRPVVPSEDQMQAFLWRFIVPREEMLVAVTGSQDVPAVWRPLAHGFELPDESAVRIPLGGTAQVALTAERTLSDGTPLETVRFRLSHNPRGVTLRDASVTSTGVAFTFKADAHLAAVGNTGNAIIEAFVDPGADADQRDAAGTGRIPLGVLPAIAFEIVVK